MREPGMATQPSYFKFHNSSLGFITHTDKGRSQLGRERSDKWKERLPRIDGDRWGKGKNSRNIVFSYVILLVPTLVPTRINHICIKRQAHQASNPVRVSFVSNKITIDLRRACCNLVWVFIDSSVKLLNVVTTIWAFLWQRNARIVGTTFSLPGALRWTLV